MRLGSALSMRAVGRSVLPGRRNSALRIFTPRPAGLLTGGSGRQVFLLLLLAIALAGLFLLLEFVVSVTSTGPRDLLAVTSSQEGTFGVPNGVGLLEFLILAVSIILALAALVVSLGWPLRRSSFRLSWSLALGVVAAASLVSAGAYLAFSGIMGDSVSYDEHMVRRVDLQSGSLILMAALFLSVTVAGLLNWRLLLASLVVWLAAASAFGFLDSKSVDGLLLFPRMQLEDVPGSFALAVRGSRQTDGTLIGQPAEPDKLLVSEVTALQDLPRRNSPVFRVTGAAHTRYLRTSTGGSYRDGTWSQLDRAAVRLETNEFVPDALVPLAEQLHLPTATPLHEFVDRIVVTPPKGAATLPAGVLPVSQGLQSVDTPATYFPFSETLASDRELSRYEMESALPLFALSQKVNADSVADPDYLQLPEALPPRVGELAEQVSGEAVAPYLKARLLQVYLQEEYAFGPAGTAREARPPVGQDPVDWFLFDRRVGTSGNFSSAFVVLARAVGVPARAVSGWVVATQEDTQTVYRRQAHQWAEIALDGLGWVTVDPFPRDAFSDTDVNHAWATALEEMATSASPAVRGAVPALRDDSDDSESLLRLFEAIDTVRNPTARHAAQTALSALVLDRFTGMLLNHENPQFRGAAAYGLGVLAAREALGALVAALAVDEDAGARVSVADALAVVGKDGAEEPLLRALAEDEDAAVRAASASALGVLKTVATASRMMPALGSDPSPEVRAEVARALGEIRDNATLLPLLDARAGDASADVRAVAAEALTEWEFADLLEILDSAAGPAHRTAAAQLMGEGRFAEAIAPLGAALSDAVEQVREAARAALEEIGEVTWLESGGGVLAFHGDLAFLPFVTAESHDIVPPTPVFRARGSSHTSLLRVAVGDIYQEGEWFPAEQEALPAGVAGIGFRSDDIRPLQAADAGDLDSIYLSGMGFAQVILSGPVPTSLHAESFSIPVSYLVPGHTVFARGPARYGWDAIVYEYSPEQLHAAETWAATAGSEYLQLPDDAWVERARVLATAITARQTTPHGKAKAIEKYLTEEYTYQPSGPSVSTVHPGQDDPIATFLFGSREGTSGAFSSAFVILARTVGIPARVVSGWAVAETSLSQIVFSNQSHQWAEVPFEDLGWVTFDPASEGAPARVPEDELAAYKRLGAEVTRLETGGALVELGGETFMSPGTTARRAEASPRMPIFEVVGATHTGYLRMAVGDLYEDGAWRQLDPGDIPYTAGSDIPGETRKLYDTLRDGFNAAFADRLASLSLFGFRQDPLRLATDRIQVLRAERSDELPYGTMPTSLDLQQKDLDGVFHPFSSTFSSEIAATDYSWTSNVPFFSWEQYAAAAAVTDATTYTQLPDDLPDHLRQLAQQITSGQDSPYAKAEALERYLRANYDYVLADSTLEGAPPAGRDPVDWFLFDTRRGTSGQFSSAFVVLARSVGIPARVVAGFVISPTAAQQAVHADQAHQWAEVALEGVGWVRFDPTASGGAPSRVPGASPAARVVESSDAGGEGASSRSDTITNITDSPVEIRRMTPFVVAGTVLTSDGRNVSGMTVEIYINETKEHGGTKIGVTTSRSGRFQAEAQLPLTMELGDHQLLARAVGNSLFTESWSDPDVQVFSGNRLELSGPAEVDRKAEAVFDGRVTDDSERGVAERVIEVRFDGSTTRSVVTDQEGRFTFSETFSQLGQHWVEVELEGEELLLDNTARLSFEVVLPTEIAVYAPDSVARGEAVLVTGELREASGPPLKGGQVELTIESAEAVDTVTVDVGEDGRFEHSAQSFEHTGGYTLTGRFSGGEFVRPAATEIVFRVLRPTVLTLDVPAAVRGGERFRIMGTLREIDGRPVPNAVVRVLGGEPFSLTTDAEGGFAGEVQATFDESAAHDPHESALRVKAVFDDTEELASSAAASDIAVGVPWILVETVKPVTRGSEATLRGAVLLGTTLPVAGVELTVGPDAAFRSNDAGAFMHTYPVSADARLGAIDLVIAAPALAVQATLRLVVKSATTLIVTPLGEVSPGGTTMLQVALLDDTGTGIAGAALRSSQGVNATTDESGIATLELAVPEREDLRGSRVEFTYDGDDLHAPLSIAYFWEGAITPGGFDWLVWVGVPVLAALVVAAGYAGRRFTVAPLIRRLRRKRAPADPALARAMVDAVESSGEGEDAGDAGESEDAEDTAESEGAEDDVGPDLQSIQLEIALQKAAEDLADVWGVDEAVGITVSVTDEGQALAGALVAVSVADSAPSELAVGDDGACTFSWSNAEPGAYTVSAEFTGDDDLVLSESRSVRIVEFREEIVRLYSVFLDWATQQGAGVSDLSTPREAGGLLVNHGLPIPEGALDAVISRFEEADYSEHEILRQHYEAMYRAMNAVLAAER